MDAGISNGLVSEYAGTQPSPGITRLLHRFPASELQPRDLFDQFVKARLPAVISGLPGSDKEQWKVHLWSDDYLMKKAGSCKVLVQDWNETESTEEAIEINYDKLISNIVAGDARYNLICIDAPVSASELDSEDEDILQSTVIDPLQMLADDFPCRPIVFGNLVVRRITLCQGISNVQCGVSSGLKHDFHDRFSLLLQGRQRFRLFPPSAASRVLGVDCPFKLYPNGLIVRLPKRGKKLAAEKVVKVRADGAPYEAIARQKRDDADKNLLRAERKLYHLRRSATSQRSELEKAMDLVNECENLHDEAIAELHRFENDSEEDCSDQSDDDVISIHDDDSDPELTEEPAAKIRKLSDFEDSLLWEEKENGKNGETMSSRPDICLSAENTDVPDELFAQCPEFKDIPCILVDLLPGEMLYLPASWFYEVTTFDNAKNDPADHTEVSLCTEENKVSDVQVSPDREQVIDSSGDNQSNLAKTSSSLPDNANRNIESRSGHLSLEYWTFPPDGDQFDQPYLDQFWPRRWAKFEKVREKIHRRTKLISSDVISLNSESSASSSASVSSDEEDEFETAADKTEVSLGVADANDESYDDGISEESLVEEFNEEHGGAILVGDDSDGESGEDINEGEEIVDDDSDDDVVDLDTVHNVESTSSLLVADEDVSVLGSRHKDVAHDVEPSAPSSPSAIADVSCVLDHSGLSPGRKDDILDAGDCVDDILDDELLLNTSSDSESPQRAAEPDGGQKCSLNSNLVDSTSKEGEDGPILIALR